MVYRGTTTGTCPARACRQVVLELLVDVDLARPLAARRRVARLQEAEDDGELLQPQLRVELGADALERLLGRRKVELHQFVDRTLPHTRVLPEPERPDVPLDGARGGARS